MLSKNLQIVGIVTSLILVTGATYGLTFAFYQPKIDSYQEQITELESKITVFKENITSLNDWKAMLSSQIEREIKRNNDLIDELDTKEKLYLDLEFKWNNTSTAIDRLKLDSVFLEKRLNQHVVITYNFEDEAILWFDIRSAAVDVDPELIPMIDILIDDYRDLYVWLDKLPEGAIPANEAVELMNEVYRILWKLLQEDLRNFDAQWIEVINRDIAELE
jgi:hypothetical protein